MVYKKKIGILIIFIVFGFSTAYILGEPLKFGICTSTYQTESYVGCLDSVGDNISEPLGLFSAALFLISVILLFTKEAVFKLWSKFSLVYIPLTVLLLSVSPTSNADIYGLDREIMAWFTSGLFLIISLLIIIIKSLKLRKSKLGA